MGQQVDGICWPFYKGFGEFNFYPYKYNYNIIGGFVYNLYFIGRDGFSVVEGYPAFGFSISF